MSDQVFRYTDVEDYLDPRVCGVAVSKKFATLDEAFNFRDIMRKGDPVSFYGVCHFTRMREEDDRIG